MREMRGHGGGHRGGGHRSFHGGGRGRGPREMHDAVCSDCGASCQVPFNPSPGRPVYCSDCFQKHRDDRGGSYRERPRREEPSAGREEESTEEPSSEEDASEEESEEDFNEEKE